MPMPNRDAAPHPRARPAQPRLTPEIRVRLGPDDHGPRSVVTFRNRRPPGTGPDRSGWRSSTRVLSLLLLSKALGRRWLGDHDSVLASAPGDGTNRPG